MRHFVKRCTATPSASKRAVREIMLILEQVVKSNTFLGNIQLLLSEAAANVVLHAYPQGTTGEIEIEGCFDINSQFIELSITDWGCGFHGCSENFAQPKLSAPEDEGGRGMYIISALADDFSVLEHEGKNILQVRIASKE